MKMLISYSSMTGNTKKLAQGIYKHFKDVADLADIKDFVDPDNYDIILHGYWVNRGGPDDSSVAFLKSLRNKKVGLFATLGAYPDSQHAMDSLENGKACLDVSNQLVGTFICHGSVSEAMKTRMYQLPKDHSHYPDAERLKRWQAAEGHPDDADITAAIEEFSNARP